MLDIIITFPVSEIEMCPMNALEQICQLIFANFTCTEKATMIE